MSKKEKAIREYLQTLTKDRVIELCLQYIFDKNVVETQLEEKDKEIEKLKQQYTILENENGKLTTELIMDKYKKAQKEVSFGKQLAISELEKVKDFILENTMLETETAAVLSYVLRQIKELSNNTFKCEICGEITPKECEGAEPNVCVDCVPIETHAVSSSDLPYATKKGRREQSID